MEVNQNGGQYEAKIKMNYWHIGPSHIGQNNRVEVTFIGADGQLYTELVGWDGLEAESTVSLAFEPVAVFADYYNRFLDAKLDKNVTATSPATIGQGKFNAIINSVGDSTMIRVEEHLVGPDNDPQIPGLNLSTRRFWNFFRNDFGEADVTAQIGFSHTNNVDNDIIHSENDSAVLLYRANILDPWHSITYTQEGNWKLGRFNVSNAQSGQYTIAAIDKTVFNVGENDFNIQKMILIPNPAENFVKIITSGSGSEILITNSLGQTMGSYDFSDKEITISVEDYPTGIYYVNLLDKKKNIISTEKLVKR